MSKLKRYTAGLSPLISAATVATAAFIVVACSNSSPVSPSAESGLGGSTALTGFPQAQGYMRPWDYFDERRKWPGIHSSECEYRLHQGWKPMLRPDHRLGPVRSGSKSLLASHVLGGWRDGVIDRWRYWLPGCGAVAHRRRSRTDPDPDGDANADSDADAERANADADPDADGDANADANADPDANASADLDAAGLKVGLKHDPDRA